MQPIQISLAAKFYLKYAVLICWTKYGGRRYFWSKTEELKITLEFRIFKLAYQPSFIFSEQFWFLGLNLLQKRYFWSKREKNDYHHEVQHIEITRDGQVLLDTDNLDFLGPNLHKIYTKRVFSTQNRESEHRYEIQQIKISLTAKFHLKEEVLTF